MVKDMSNEQLTELVKKLRTVATSPQTMSATLQGEARRKRPVSAAQQKRRDLLDSL